MSTTLVTHSLAVIEAGQGAHGAYIACPAYPTYNYCWFRDGTFIAVAMDRWQKHESARRFYDWATSLVVEQAEAIERCVENAAQGRPLNPANLLHTRYTLEGQRGNEEWPNFQLDGFGTLLWGLQQHMQMVGLVDMPPTWNKASALLVRYLTALWQRPNSDCWEEFSDQIAVSTLATLYAGLHAISTVLEAHGQDATLALETSRQIKAFLLSSGARDGHLIKQIGGEDVVDASLLWASVPFQEHGLFQSSDPLIQATVARIEQDLLGKAGGVRRYARDTFYGGGEWVLLTALLGEYYVATSNLAGAKRCLAFVEGAANEQGDLPEQIIRTPLYPEYVERWHDRWGPVACPLLWSHAAYLSLKAQVPEV